MSFKECLFLLIITGILGSCKEVLVKICNANTGISSEKSQQTSAGISFQYKLFVQNSFLKILEKQTSKVEFKLKELEKLSQAG